MSLSVTTALCTIEDTRGTEISTKELFLKLQFTFFGHIYEGKYTVFTSYKCSLHHLKDSTQKVPSMVSLVTNIVTDVIFECILNVTLLFEYRKAGDMFRARK